MSQLAHDLQILPAGDSSEIGERGVTLSGGQKQRVAIARTILKRPPIMVFDEATSSLDSQSEQAILQALREISQGHTSFVVAHRLSTIMDADSIIVMDQGEIIEQGTHHELLSQDSLYAKLWSAQQSRSDLAIKESNTKIADTKIGSTKTGSTKSER